MNKPFDIFAVHFIFETFQLDAHVTFLNDTT